MSKETISQWTPTAAAMPAASATYLVATRYRDFVVAQYDAEAKGFYENGAKMGNVIAWRELGERFEGE